ncbi:MAG TPA: glycosyltransferase [Acidimicrobiales bacterium]|nr:glycosyltransferase [Acidimicrobiales bacterium]
MKVLLVHNRYRSGSPSGEDRVVDQEAMALASNGHLVERFERFSDDIARRSIGARALVPAQVLWSDEVRRSLRQALQQFRPDVVHVHNTFPLLSPSVLYACRSERVPVVATMHHYRLVCPSGDLFRNGEVCHDCVGRFPLPAVRHGCYRSSVLATLPLAAGGVAHRRAWRTMVSAYVFLSAAQRDLIAQDGLPSNRLFVKPNFVPPPAVAQKQAPEDFVVYAGRLTESKGVHTLMDAWDRYRSQSPESHLRLVIAGAGPLEQRVAQWATPRPSVDWLGMLARDACSALITRARAVIVPSQWEETFGLVVVEAMAAGVPSIASHRGSFPELIQNGVDGVLVEAGNASAWARAFEDIQRNGELYKALGSAARRTYEQRFSLRANVDQLVRIYRFAVNHAVQ